MTLTLVVSDTDSRCDSCGHNSLITLTHETTPPGYSGRPTVPGCGVAYEAVAGDINGLGEPRWVAEKLGLPYVGRMPWPACRQSGAPVQIGGVGDVR